MSMASFFHLSALLCIYLSTSVGAAPQVRLGGTTLIGTANLNSSVEFFGGIPFAEPPTGSLRYRPPVLKTHLRGSSFNATNFGLPCLQAGIESSEDCLTINVLRPTGISSNSSVPVLVWIYGGGFTTGGGDLYNGTTIVRQSSVRGTPVIYVNFNYRLGPLGFPQGAEAVARGALNLGLKDQIAALQWVQKNIGAFGGDKTKVTVFGESAGAVSIGVHYLRPSFSNLARAAIFQSGSAGTTLAYPGNHRQANWDDYVKAVPGCASLVSTPRTFECLRKQNSTTLLAAHAASDFKAVEQFPWVPSLDGAGGLFPDFPSKLYAKGQFARLPFISGANLDEGTILVPQTINTSQAIREIIIKNYTGTRLPGVLEAAADKVLQLYPDDPAVGSPYGTGNNTFGLGSQFKRGASLMGDLFFHSSRRLWTQAAVRAGVKAYGYHLTEQSFKILPELGVSHVLDVFYLYGDVPGFGVGGAIPPVLASQIVDYWISFAVSLDPSDGKGTSRTKWPQYTLKNKDVLQLSVTDLKPVPDTFRAAQINFLNKDPVLFRH
ncbi:hypothetical protein HGRIS_012120 [Hohenbuehelia grisea]|uniref:Carboxylic ester hydrolase n=1 Tax=Hohenbuehelia grisea TaxID=104357 RepID=A0ABR3IRD5_9AGAR